MTTRPMLIYLYFKTYGRDGEQSHSYSLFVASSHSLLTLLPFEMLIFFGYEGLQTNEYDQGLINYSWLRRIVSSLRIVIQLISVTGLLAGEFVTLACASQTIALTILLTSIWPEASTYDAQTWYRRV